MRQYTELYFRQKESSVHHCHHYSRLQLLLYHLILLQKQIGGLSTVVLHIHHNLMQESAVLLFQVR